MSNLPGIDAKLIKLNSEWSVEKADSTPLETNQAISDFKGNRLIITLPGAGGFCDQEFEIVKGNMEKFKKAGADEVIVVVGTDILSNAGREIPNLLQDVDHEFAKANSLGVDGLRSRYLNRAAIAINAQGEQVLREDAPLLGCRTLDALVSVAEKAFQN